MSRVKTSLLGGAALAAALGVAGGALAQQASAADARDAKINQLEAQVRALVAANQREAAQIQSLTADIGELKAVQTNTSQTIATLQTPHPRHPRPSPPGTRPARPWPPSLPASRSSPARTESSA